MHSTAAGVEMYIDSSLNSETTYYYKVVASKNGYLSDYSNVVSGTTLSAYDEATITLIAAGRYTNEPTQALKELIDLTIKGLKSDGVHQQADAYYFRGVHESVFACQNWAKNDHNSTLVNNPTFTAKVGFTGDGLAMAINNNYKPFSDGDNLQLTDLTIALYQKTVSTINASRPFGAFNTLNNYILLMNQYIAENERFYAGSLLDNRNVNVTNDKVVSYSRIGNEVQGYLDGSVSGGVRTLSSTTGLPDLNMHELCAIVGSTLTTFSNGSLSFTYYGAALDATKMTALYNRVRYFYDNVDSTF